MTVQDKILVGLASLVLVVSLLYRWEEWRNRKWEKRAPRKK